MAFTQAPRATAGLLGITELSRRGVTGTANVGSNANESLSLATEGVTFEIEVDGSNTITIDLSDFTVTPGGTGALQVETAAIVGTVTTSGNMNVVVTSANVTGSPLTVPVAVLSGDNASDVGGKIRTALGAVAAITDVFTVGGASNAVSLTNIEYLRNDPTLNIAYDNGTADGLTPDATSTDTTAGAIEPAVTSLSGVAWAAENFEGGALPTPAVYFGMEVTVQSGSDEGVLVESGTFYSDYIQLGETAHKHSAAVGGINLLPSDDLVFTGQGAYCKALVTLMFSTS